MASKHAILSASSAARWIACPPSARLNAVKPDAPSEYAIQGTEAHRLCEYKLRKALGEKVRDPTKNLSFYDSEMEECAEAYCQFVMEAVVQSRATSKDTLVLVEQRVDFSGFVPDGFVRRTRSSSRERPSASWTTSTVRASRSVPSAIRR